MPTDMSVGMGKFVKKDHLEPVKISREFANPVRGDYDIMSGIALGVFVPARVAPPCSVRWREIMEGKREVLIAPVPPAGESLCECYEFAHEDVLAHCA